MIERIRKSLVLKTALIFFAAVLIPYVVVAAFFLGSSKKALYNEIVDGLNTRIGLFRDALDARVYLLRGNAVAWAELDVMSDILVDDIDKRISKIFKGLKRDYRLTGEIYAMNLDGRVVASSNPHAIGRSVKSKWVQRTLAGEMMEMDIHPSELGTGKVVSFAIPVTALFDADRTIGALVLESNLTGLKESLLSGDIEAGIFTDSGETVLASDGWPFEKEAVLSIRNGNGKKLKNLTPGYIVASASSGAYYDFRGFGWTVIGAASEDEALKPIRTVQFTSIVIGTVGILWIFGLVSIFASRTVRPIKELSMTADHIARTKDFSLKVKRASSDEVGDLADAFNHMVGEVNAHLGLVKEMEGEMRRADRLSALGELSAGMAHEVKNPLGMIKSSADMLKKRYDEKDPDGALMKVISEEAERLAGILDAFLRFARPAAPVVAPSDINEVVDRALSLVGPELKKGSIELVRRSSTELPLVSTDPDQLYQVLINIIINAIQAMEPGGTLTVGSSRVDGPRSKKIKSRAGFVEIAITDTGKGIPVEEFDKIFNPFYTTKETGSGLGLSIVQRIIDGLGGFVLVEKNPAEGSSFMIYLPLEEGGDNEDHTGSR